MELSADGDWTQRHIKREERGKEMADLARIFCSLGEKTFKTDNDLERETWLWGGVLTWNLFSVTCAPDLWMAIQQGASCFPRVMPEKPHRFRLLLSTKLWKCRQRLGGVKKKCQRTARSVCFLCSMFWLCYAACGILVPRAGTEPVPPAVEAWSLNHWTTREAPGEGLCIRELSKTILKLAGGILLLTTERMITHSYWWMKRASPTNLF